MRNALTSFYGRNTSNLPPRYSKAELELVAKAKGSPLSLKERLDEPVIFNQYLKSSNKMLDVMASALLHALEAEGFIVAQQKRRKYLDSIKIVVLNLMLARLNSPYDFVAYSRTNGAYQNVPYRPFVKVIDALTERGFIEHYIGFKNRGKYDKVDSRLSRMRAKSKFIRIYECFMLEYNSIYLENQPLVIRKKDSRGRKTERSPKSKPRIQRLTSSLKIVNEQIAKSAITISLTEAASKLPCSKYNSYDPRHVKLYRIFGDDQLTTHGRFYGHWFQFLPRELRPFVRIDGEPIAYLDYGSCHTNMIYALEGLPPCGDAYDIGTTLIPRDYLKIAQAIMIHGVGKDPGKSIANSVQKANLKKKPWQDKIETKKGWGQIAYEGLLKRHSGISRYFGSQLAKKLMYYDSCLAEEILLTLAREGITCIPMHDGFVVAQRHRERLHRAMLEAYRCMFGQEPIIK